MSVSAIVETEIVDECYHRDRRLLPGDALLRLPLDTAEPPTQKLLSVLVIAFLHAAYMLLFVNKAGVVEAARTPLANGTPVKPAMKKQAAARVAS